MVSKGKVFDFTTDVGPVGIRHASGGDAEVNALIVSKIAEINSVVGACGFIGVEEATLVDVVDHLIPDGIRCVGDVGAKAQGGVACVGIHMGDIGIDISESVVIAGHHCGVVDVRAGDGAVLIAVGNPITIVGVEVAHIGEQSGVIPVLSISSPGNACTVVVACMTKAQGVANFMNSCFPGVGIHGSCTTIPAGVDVDCCLPQGVRAKVGPCPAVIVAEADCVDTACGDFVEVDAEEVGVILEDVADHVPPSGGEAIGVSRKARDVVVDVGDAGRKVVSGFEFIGNAADGFDGRRSDRHDRNCEGARDR